MTENNIKNIAVIGTGAIGLHAAILLAKAGYKVTVIGNPNSNY